MGQRDFTTRDWIVLTCMVLGGFLLVKWTWAFLMFVLKAVLMGLLPSFFN